MTGTRIRRTRRTGAAKVTALTLSRKQKDDLVGRLNSIADMQVRIAKMQGEMADAEAEVFNVMNNVGLFHLDGDGCFADILQSSGKAQNIIDPKGLRAKLEDSEYYQCISVSVTKAREFLGAKALSRITTTIPAVAGPYKLKVTRLASK